MSAQIRTVIANETRALLPAWIAGAVAATVAGSTRGDVHQFSQFTFAAATIAVGAQAIGHEYAHGTLGLTLTLPVARWRVFLAKLTVVGAMVLPLAVYARLLGLFADVPAWTPWLIAASALCLAPALTMVCRSQLAGTIFGMSMPGLVLIAVMIVTQTPLDAPPAAEHRALAAWSLLMVPVLTIGAALGWWLFLRIESIEGRMAEIHPAWRTGTVRAGRPQTAWWQLVKKEIRLQQMTFTIAALYLATCAAAEIFRLPSLPRSGVPAIGAVTVFYELGLCAVVGSLATAEERQLGTLAWQLQLPLSAWKQWAVKAATVFGVAFLVSIVVPVRLVPALWPDARPIIELPVILAIVMTAVSMYVSSLSTTAVRALVTSTVALSFVLGLVLKPELWSGRAQGSIAWLSLVAVLLAGFAFVNHRHEPPAPARVQWQLLSLSVVVAVGVLAFSLTT